MKNLTIKLLLSVLVLAGAGATRPLYSMDEASGYTERVRDVYFEVGSFINTRTPQETADRLAELKSKIAKLSPAETRLTDNFTGNETILEVIKNTQNTNDLSPQIRQGLSEAIRLLEAKRLNK